MTDQFDVELRIDALRRRAIPPGFRFSLIAAAMGKRAVGSTSHARQRLGHLEDLAGMIDNVFTEAVMATIPPLSDLAATMLLECRSIDPPTGRMTEAAGEQIEIPPADGYKLLTSDSVFWTIVRACPALLDPLELLAPDHSRPPARAVPPVLPATPRVEETEPHPAPEESTTIQVQPEETEPEYENRGSGFGPPGPRRFR